MRARALHLVLLLSFLALSGGGYRLAHHALEHAPQSSAETADHHHHGCHHNHHHHHGDVPAPQRNAPRPDPQDDCDLCHFLTTAAATSIDDDASLHVDLAFIRTLTIHQQRRPDSVADSDVAARGPPTHV